MGTRRKWGAGAYRWSRSLIYFIFVQRVGFEIGPDFVVHSLELSAILLSQPPFARVSGARVKLSVHSILLP